MISHRQSPPQGGWVLFQPQRHFSVNFKPLPKLNNWQWLPSTFTGMSVSMETSAPPAVAPTTLFNMSLKNQKNQIHNKPLIATHHKAFCYSLLCTFSVPLSAVWVGVLYNCVYECSFAELGGFVT